jgi:ribosome modulation factor
MSKRIKRDKFIRAYHKGYHMAIAGRCREACPHMDTDLRIYWHAGWYDAKAALP